MSDAHQPNGGNQQPYGSQHYDPNLNQPGQYGQPSYGHQAPQMVNENPYAYAPTAPSTQENSSDTTSHTGVGRKTLIGGMLVAALVGAGTYGLVDMATGSDNVLTSSTQGASTELIVNNENSVNAVTGAAAKASPSVVTISSVSGNQSGSGSGIILDEEGHILTNTHVVTLDGQTNDPTLEVQLSDGTVTSATVVGTDPLSDLAVIKIEANNLVPAELGDSSKLNVGDTTIAIGAPLGLSGTVTDGIVSTTDRTITVASSAVPDTPTEGNTQDQGSGSGGWSDFFFDYGQGSSQGQTESVFLNVLQTDAAINPGNSGGPLVNTDGQVVGINVAIASASSSGSGETGAGNIGVGFAIPINHAKRVAEEIIDSGEATHGYLGATVSASAANDGQSQSFSEGAEVQSVESGSPASDAGLRQGDVVLSFNGHRIQDASELTAAVRELPAEGEGELVFIRGGNQQTVNVTVGNAKDAAN
ncbi:S1C family serine protease [Kocuria sp.]|uniref:S1C family serine protease n=1 Tax=Kocuria sp. TaxID=1871328 RepID=UPI0026E05821|nr:trypsin-like peptidase domain-containing protein [Kocuria sp.]MDO5619569.1 trypsin-like peptidase domain-containing protein [Kocuria sp.]